MLFLVATILLLVVVEVVPGIPAAVETVLVYAIGASAVLFMVSSVWEVRRAYLHYRDARPEMGAAKHH